MLLALGIVFPVFALILAGWVVGRRGLLPVGAVEALNGFVTRIALPVLMAQFVAEADWRALWHPGFVAAMGGGIMAVFLAGLLMRRRRPLGDASMEALAASYANTAFMGLPLGKALFGEIGTAAAVIASLLTVTFVFAIAVTLVEYELHRGRGLSRTAAGVLGGLARNPMVAGPAVGGAWALTGVVLPQPVHAAMALLGGAASPVALVTIGLFLGTAPIAGEGRHVAPLVALKLVAHPLATWGLVRALGVPHPWDAAAVLIAALPTGTGPFMVAGLYGRDAGVVARTILWTTLLSVATVTAVVIAVS